jgi:hypothetical protein
MSDNLGIRAVKSLIRGGCCDRQKTAQHGYLDNNRCETQARTDEQSEGTSGSP